MRAAQGDISKMSRVTTVLVATSVAIMACSSTSTTPGGGGNHETQTDGGTASSDGGTSGGDGSLPGDDTGTPPPSDDSGSSVGCGAWGVGTLTGYNNSNLADDPNAGSVME